MGKLTKSSIDAAKPMEKDYFLWDPALSGFGVRIFPSGKKTYLIQYRKNGRTRRYKIGPHVVFTVDQARTRAKILLGLVADGKDPSDERKEKLKGITLKTLCKMYLEEGCYAKKESTILTDRGRIERHIKPLLGSKSVQSIEKVDVEKFLADIAKGKTVAQVKTKKHGLARVRGGKGTATRTVGLLGSIFTFAIKKGIRTTNPVHGVKKYPDRKIGRFLNSKELKTLGEALNKAEKDGVNSYAINLIRHLALHGCRRGELLTLEWKNVDLENGFLILPESKTGHKI
ncbi:MAG: integrase arm-type DNA-binding domain-containing protein, partial [Proteobacteria bacterium]|nr:integrase arm-type DNA-binding domain-containing protein [Pseudomonadota bacterium]